MKKVWIDLETGGLNAKTDAILQLSMIVEDEDGKVIGEYSTYIDPHPSLNITEEAIAINGITQAQIATAPREKEVMDNITSMLNKEQHEFCGYNSRFDMDFIVQMFKRTNNKYFYWDYFNYYDIDVFALVKILGITGERFDEKKAKTVPCKKLECICELFGIKIKAHDAKSDIKATRKLYKKIIKRYIK